jgi:hypothetical protein
VTSPSSDGVKRVPSSTASAAGSIAAGASAELQRLTWPAVPAPAVVNDHECAAVIATLVASFAETTDAWYTVCAASGWVGVKV